VWGWIGEDLLGKGIMTSEGELWKRQRTYAPTSPRVITEFAGIIGSE